MRLAGGRQTEALQARCINAARDYLRIRPFEHGSEVPRADSLGLDEGVEPVSSAHSSPALILESLDLGIL